MIEDFLLKERLNIYNNRAKSGESLGRLTVVYNIYPAPAIFWEFEPESKQTNLPPYDGNGKLILPFECNSFSIVDPFLYPNDELETHLSGGARMRGSTTRAVVGDPTIMGKSFTFFLPNARFQEVGVFGKNFLVKEITYKKLNASAELEFGGNFQEGFVEANIGNRITLKMQTPIESINWLKARRSIGTFITTRGELSVGKDISIVEAADLLDDITFLLSFANGGFIAPIVVRMNRSDFEKEYPSAFTAYVVDPIEHVAGTWLDGQSDLGDLLNCFPAFQKMLQTAQWKENYWLILMWYFQAIQPLGIQLGGKPWPVAANALGAALEKLASIILVEEKKCVSKEDFYGNHKKKRRGMSLEDKVRKLLETIGVDHKGPKYDGNDAVWWFKEMRNDATHPKSSKKWMGEEVNVILNNAIQWVEESLLWRLGYAGGYSDRSRSSKFLESPRYKLDTRDTSW